MALIHLSLAPIDLKSHTTRPMIGITLPRDISILCNAKGFSAVVDVLLSVAATDRVHSLAGADRVRCHSILSLAFDPPRFDAGVPRANASFRTTAQPKHFSSVARSFFRPKRYVETWRPTIRGRLHQCPRPLDAPAHERSSFKGRRGIRCVRVPGRGRIGVALPSEPQ